MNSIKTKLLLLTLLLSIMSFSQVTLNQYQMAVGNSSNQLSGSSSLTYNNGLLTMGSTTDNYLAFSNQAGTSYLQNDGSGHFIWYTPASSGAAKMKLANGGNLLIGTTSDAGYKLDVNGTGRFSDVLRTNGGIQIVGDGSITQVAGLHLRYTGQGYVDAANYVTGAFLPLHIRATDVIFDDGGAEKGRFLSNGNLLIGTTSDAGYKLAVNGDAIFNKIKVKQYPWADYVFNPDYKLPPLKEVEEFIKQYKHLPDIPSAEEVKKEGIDVGDTQASLLKKIEELTLYVIDLNKKVDKLTEENDALKKKVSGDKQ